mmetsp:Transcript_17600/g.54619  ORF Transcript_17600/g.54619 Transcript_17600/m.54619 type:complete len:223 (+) Transcript_17600:264-932(+)
MVLLDGQQAHHVCRLLLDVLGDHHRLILCAQLGRLQQRHQHRHRIVRHHLVHHLVDQALAARPGVGQIGQVVDVLAHEGAQLTALFGRSRWGRRGLLGAAHRALQRQHQPLGQLRGLVKRAPLKARGKGVRTHRLGVLALLTRRPARGRPAVARRHAPRACAAAPGQATALARPCSLSREAQAGVSGVRQAGGRLGEGRGARARVVGLKAATLPPPRGPARW